MTSLRELQATMAAELDGASGARATRADAAGTTATRELDAAARIVFDGALPARERLAIYANNSWCAFRNTLEMAFPAVLRLGGREWFDGAAHTYRAAHPSRAGDLHWVGAAFPRFLREQLDGTQYAVIADVAALEWAYQQVLVAAEPRPFDVTALADVAVRDYGALHFSLAPSCALVASDHPVLDVWRVNRGTDPALLETPTIDLAAGPQRVLLRRHDLEVELHRLDAPTYAFLDALSAGDALATASERALELDPDFPLAAVLQRHVALGVLGEPRLIH